MDHASPGQKSPHAGPAHQEHSEVFLARQPIVDRAGKVVAFEVLFRGGRENRAVISDGFRATSQMLLNTFVNIGLDQVVGDYPAYVNLTREFLVGEFALPLAKDKLVLEILEDVEVDEELIAGVRGLVDQGFTLALDDVIFEDKLVPLLELAQIVKVELPKIPRKDWGEHLRRFRDYKVQVLAEKVETPADFERCRDLGFDLFQGYFLTKPQLIAGKQPTTHQLGVLQLMSELSLPDVSIDDLERILKRDASLSFKLLRYINSANYGLRRRVESLRQAIVMLGIQGVRTITMLVALSNLSCDRPETLRLALQRALICEKLAKTLGGCDANACFTVGLISMMDAVIGVPLDRLLPTLPVSDSIRLAVTERQGSLGEILRRAISLEQEVEALVLDDAAQFAQVQTAYLQAVKEADRIWTSDGD